MRTEPSRRSRRSAIHYWTGSQFKIEFYCNASRAGSGVQDGKRQGMSTVVFLKPLAQWRAARHCARSLAHTPPALKQGTLIMLRRASPTAPGPSAICLLFVAEWGTPAGGRGAREEELAQDGRRPGPVRAPKDGNLSYLCSAASLSRESCMQGSRWLWLASWPAIHPARVGSGRARARVREAEISAHCVVIRNAPTKNKKRKVLFSRLPPTHWLKSPSRGQPGEEREGVA